MARNRKRAKERRGRRPQSSLATARAERAAADQRAAPDPIAHASPDSELAEAQLALGRPELAPAENNAAPEPDAEEFGSEPGAGLTAADLDEGDAPEQAGAELSTTGGHAPAGPATSGNRLVNFLQGSWRELQRVQWPDRRQVLQATGVVIGFVVVAGLYLGAADWVAGKIVNLIIK